MIRFKYTITDKRVSINNIFAFAVYNSNKKTASIALLVLFYLSYRYSFVTYYGGDW